MPSALPFFASSSVFADVASSAQMALGVGPGLRSLFWHHSVGLESALLHHRSAIWVQELEGLVNVKERSARMIFWKASFFC